MTKTKPITIQVTSIGRKSKYIAIQEPGYVYPVVYFRKSKFATDEQYKQVINYILENLK
jgi:hypothetical protein